MKLLDLQTLELEEIKAENLPNIEDGNIFMGFGPWNAGTNHAWRVGSIQANIASQNYNYNNSGTATYVNGQRYIVQTSIH